MRINKKTPVLIIGFGSIGKRHYKNLLQLGYNNIAVFDPLNSAFKGFSDVGRVENLNVETIKDYKVVFICSPNSLHIKHALICAQAGCHFFIEKPLSHDLRNIEALQKLCQKKKLITMVGCNLRFHPCLKFIKDYLDKNKLGKVYSIGHEFGYYLPYWRPRQDYRKSYAAKRETGGGIIFDDIHELDLLFWFNKFEKVVESKFMFDKVSNLEIMTEDICIASFKFKNKVLGLVKCDYLQQDHTRNCKIVGEKGNLEWDFKENIVWLHNKQGSKKLFKIKNFDLNGGFINEVKYFFACIEKRQKTFNEIKTAYTILTYCIKRV